MLNKKYPPPPLTKFLARPFVFGGLSFAEHFQIGVSSDGVFLGQFRFLCGVHLGQDDGVRRLFQLLGSFLILRGQGFAMATPVEHPLVLKHRVTDTRPTCAQEANNKRCLTPSLSKNAYFSVGVAGCWCFYVFFLTRVHVLNNISNMTQILQNMLLSKFHVVCFQP